jgi:5-deoxy-glucuronate isomerase
MQSRLGRVNFKVEQLVSGTPLSIGGDALEYAVVLLSGRCSLTNEDGHTLAELSRQDTFDERGSAVYIPRWRSYQLETRGAGALVAIASTQADSDRAFAVVRPDEVRVERRGRGAWSREVHTLIESGKTSDRLLIGETFSGEGVWSSYPPHKHDQMLQGVESMHDEYFFVRVRPATGFGILIRYESGADREGALVLKDGDVVPLPSGYHSVVAAGGHELYYLWALAGEQAEFRWNTDPRYAWLLVEEAS